MISVPENETSDVGYCSATYTGPSSKDMQGQTSSGYHYSEPIPGKTSILPIVMKKKTPSDPANLDLSQPTLKEHETVNGWPLQSNDEHYYNSGSLNLSQVALGLKTQCPLFCVRMCLTERNIYR